MLTRQRSALSVQSAQLSEKNARPQPKLSGLRLKKVRNIPAPLSRSQATAHLSISAELTAWYIFQSFPGSVSSTRPRLSKRATLSRYMSRLLTGKTERFLSAIRELRTTPGKSSREIIRSARLLRPRLSVLPPSERSQTLSTALTDLSTFRRLQTATSLLRRKFFPSATRLTLKLPTSTLKRSA